MAIVTREYFKYDEVFIPHAKQDVSDTVTGVKDNIQAFIERNEREALTLLLGSNLYNQLKTQLDPNQSNGLLVGSDQKWDDLLNGKEYVIDDKTVNFRGIRFKDTFETEEYLQSLIAYYIYGHYVISQNSNFAGAGIQKEKSANSLSFSNHEKVMKAFRTFYELSVGSYYKYTITYSYNSVGYDYFNSPRSERSLYEFIRDQNLLVADTYENWQPSFFENSNRFGV